MFVWTLNEQVLEINKKKTENDKKSNQTNKHANKNSNKQQQKNKTKIQKTFLANLVALYLGEERVGFTVNRLLLFLHPCT